MPAESFKKKKLRMNEIIRALKQEYPDSKCSLKYESPFQLLIATILSAQCTDERVNKVTAEFFSKVPTVHAMADLSRKEIAKEIYSTGFYNNKSKSIQRLCEVLLDEYSGEVPDNMMDLVNLPGTGRKTANVILGNAFGIPGLVVDTHVIRISNLLKLVHTRNAVKIEKELMNVVNEEDWTLFAHLFIDHGRAVCVANRPKCGDCVIKQWCPSEITTA